MRPRRGLIVALAAAALLAGCAGNPFNASRLQPGASRQQVLEHLGPPTRIVPLAGGERLQYSLQPFGRQAWMVDLDATGHVVSARQVLNTLSFNRIEPGRWTRADVEREFGPPARIDSVARWNGPVLTYFWRDLDRADMFYWVYLDPQGLVQRAHPGMEFINDPDERL